MNERALGRVLLKLLGIYYLVAIASGSVQLLNTVGLDWSEGRLFWATSGLTIVVLGAAASTLLLNTDGIASRLFPDTVADSDPPATDQLQRALLVGVGVFLVADALPSLAHDLGTLLWYAGAERQEQLEDFLPSLRTSIVDGLLRMVIGTSICLGPRTILGWIGRLRVLRRSQGALD